MRNQIIHQPVLLKEIIENLKLKSKLILVDGTFGGGGHSLACLKENPKLKIIALDEDSQTFKIFKKKFPKFIKKISFHLNNFRNLDQILKIEKIKKIDALILDLGFSSDQLENSGRGFSFQKNEPLLMTLKDIINDQDLTAKEILNYWSEESLFKILKGYGEEKFSKKIAKAIVEHRQKQEIKNTFDLLLILKENLPLSYQKRKIHYATKTFQALRIAVNDELGSLSKVLEISFNKLNSQGRILVISFHSLEDRIVKRFFKEKAKETKAILINKKVILASNEEIIKNPRARSAKLRILEKK